MRVGNGAWNQSQLDVYGELMGAAYRFRNELTGIADEPRALLVGVAHAAAARWFQKDQGIWEIRGKPRAFVHSKVMCWVAIDRAIKLADRLDAKGDVPYWETVRDESPSCACLRCFPAGTSSPRRRWRRSGSR